MTPSIFDQTAADYCAYRTSHKTKKALRGAQRCAWFLVGTCSVQEHRFEHHWQAAEPGRGAMLGGCAHMRPLTHRGQSNPPDKEATAQSVILVSTLSPSPPSSSSSIQQLQHNYRFSTRRSADSNQTPCSCSPCSCSPYSCSPCSCSPCSCAGSCCCAG